MFYPLVTGKDLGCGVAYLRIPRQQVLRPFDKARHYRALEREVPGMTDEGLGGGNHFLALEESADYLYLIVHTGSRNLGIYLYQQHCQMLREHDPGAEWLPLELATPEYRQEYARVLAYAASRRREFLLKTYDFLLRNHYVAAGTPVLADSCHNLLEFRPEGVIHRKGSTQLVADEEVVIPLSMSRGCLIVKPNRWDPALKQALWSCAHGAGRRFSRTDTLKYWHSLKRVEKDGYRQRFAELLNRQGDFDSSILQEFDFTYKDSAALLATQPHLLRCDETRPIITVKFTGVQVTDRWAKVCPAPDRPTTRVVISQVLVAARVYTFTRANRAGQLLLPLYLPVCPRLQKLPAARPPGSRPCRTRCWPSSRAGAWPALP